MLSGFIVKRKDQKIPVSITAWPTLLEAMQKDVISPSIDEFYCLSRTALVKDEQNFDKFDRAFGEYFKGIESIAGIEFDVPLEWLLARRAESVAGGKGDDRGAGRLGKTHGGAQETPR